MALPDPDALAEIVASNTAPGDLVVCLGAGSISAWANALPGDLQYYYGHKQGAQG